MSASVGQRSIVLELIGWLASLFGGKRPTSALREPAGVPPMIEACITAAVTPSLAFLDAASISEVSASVPKTAAMRIGSNFMLSARTASVARLNPPSSRAVKRKLITAPPGKQIPKPAVCQLKPQRATRVASISSRQPSVAPGDNRPTAVVIDLAAAKRARRQKAHHRAA